jgi:hypothetical protein
MKKASTTQTIRPEASPNASTLSSKSTEAGYQKLPAAYRPLEGKTKRDPIDYVSHLYPSMEAFAQFLTLRFDANFATVILPLSPKSSCATTSST